MSPRPCPRGWEHDAVREGRLGPADAASFWRHVKACSECAADVARDERLRALGRSWHAEGPSALEVRRLRAHILRDVANAPARGETRGRRALALGLLAAAVAVPALAMVLRHPVPPVSGAGQEAARASSAPGLAVPMAETSFAGTIVAAQDVHWSRTRENDIERVYLTGGSLAVHVRPQKVGERFLVVLPDGELEVRGTTFQVAVADGATSNVHVDEGVVELRLRGNDDRRLGAGESWPEAAPGIVAAAAARQRLRAGGARPADPGQDTDTTTTSSSVQPPPPASRLDGYAEAMRLLQAGRAEDAAAAFHAFAAAHPGAPQAEDASFLEALALARAGRRDAAGLAAERHLGSYPHSFHAKDAAILVARAAASRGDCVRARTVLSPWSSSAGAEVESLLRVCDTVP